MVSIDKYFKQIEIGLISVVGYNERSVDILADNMIDQ